MKKTNRQPAKKPATKSDTFTIELNPPKFIRGLNEFKAILYEKLKRTVDNCPSGAAFIIEVGDKNSAMRFLKAEYPKAKFRFVKIPGNDKHIRVYHFSLKKLNLS